MLNYRKILDWHQNNEMFPDSDSGSDAERLETHLQKQYVEKKLDAGLSRIWQDVQTKVRVLVLASNLSEFSIDNFIRFLDIIHRLIQVGKEFSGADSETLHESLQKQCLSYFKTYHTSRLDELKTHLENEGWALCPVKPSFTLKSLVEFSHLKPQRSPSKKMPGEDGSYFKRFWDSRTPFDDALKDLTGEEDILLDTDGDSDSDEDLSEEQKMEIRKENEGMNNNFASLKEKSWIPPPPKQGICLGNTTLMMLRLVGRYSHLMKLLHPIADQILLGMKQLFDFYLFTVHKFFSGDLPETETRSGNLKNYFKKIESEILIKKIIVSETDEQGTPFGREKTRGIVHEPCMPLSIDLNRKDTNCGLNERIIAVESCLFLAGQISELLPILSSSSRKPEILKDFSHTLSLVREMTAPVYFACLMKLLSLDQIVPIMGKVSWELKEVRSQHSEYVDIMLNQLQADGHTGLN